MFNWFKRRHSKKESSENLQETKTAPETPETTTVESTESSQPQTQEQTQEDYLAWAKAAYENIQQRKEEEQATPSETIAEETEATAVTEEVVKPETVEEPEATVPEEIAAAKSEQEEVTEAPEVVEETTQVIAELETTTATTEVIEEITEAPVATEEATKVTEVIEETAAAAKIEEVETETSPNIPVWMQKSEGLEKLKETAIATPVAEPEVTEPELDEDFVWSAKVLAQEGRSPEDISQEEINWLTKLRQGLGKTRRSLVVQLKSVVGQGPLNKEAVMEIEAILLQADVGIEATDFIIETLQEKLREEALPPRTSDRVFKVYSANYSR